MIVSNNANNDPDPGANRSLSRLAEELRRLPGIGPRVAQRIAYHLAQAHVAEARALSEAILAVQDCILFCDQCRNLTDASPCAICASPQRNRDQICVVEESRDLTALERTRAYRGLYHVLHTASSRPSTASGQRTSIYHNSLSACRTRPAPCKS